MIGPGGFCDIVSLDWSLKISDSEALEDTDNFWISVL